MSEPIVHASFSVERTFPAPLARVFGAFADPELKAKWFHGPDGWEPRTRTLDFREGGHEAADAEREAGTIRLLKQPEASV